MSATENRSEENSPASARKGERTRASCPAFCSLLLSWLMQKASRAAKSLGRRATGGRSERREALQPFSTPITPASHPTPGDPVCMETLQKDKGGRGLGCGGGAGLPVLPWVRGQWEAAEGNQKLERLGEAVLENCGNSGICCA